MMFQSPWYMQNGVFPIHRAYVFAFATTHAGVSEMP